ncbi:hypothetical protein HYPSUDRAFT_76037 [Hypholoma sublateritium FD-334 SS-4]|uniref:Uncharacterized protein n=1 Tax=Hypholoma sublateritium (strain FD-334 SS-4) TaxID=945553 RepID=A0A0D2Q185_HYPSF|nr:hypothetical protein HYPSUDRAFT_76037 [Hypholoma sublateritium FD-334 SS-4]
MQDSHIPNLDDVSKTSYYIPFNPSSTKREEHKPKTSIPKSHFEDRDLNNGRELRLSAYKDAWTKCLGRMQEIVRDLQAASVKDVINEVQHSYSNILPGLPFPELPVISLTNSGLGSAVLDSITSELEGKTAIYGGENSNCVLAHIYPGDIPNITTGMRSIITGLIEKQEVDSVKRKSTTSLATYDIKYLIAWYKIWAEDSEGSSPHIIVLLHEFEQIDPLVMRDIFDICSRYVSELPLIFLLSMTSPVSNYLNVTYPRSTLSLLRVRQFSAPTGNEILDALIFNTFFDLEFQPDIMIGPAVFQYIQDYFARYNPSVDTIFTVLQLAHLKHFSTDPLAVFVKDTPSVETLASPDSSPFIDALRNRINTINADEEIPADQYSALVDFVDDARYKFYRGLHSMKLGLHVMLSLLLFLEEQGYTGLKGSPDSGRSSKLWDAMDVVLGGDPERAIKGLAFVARKLKQRELGDILGRMYKLINGLAVALSSAEEEQHAKSEIVAMRTHLTQCGEDDNSFVDVVSAFSTWITGYLTTKLRPLENCPLWDIWYTGLSPFPSDIINPSIRASLVAGLLQPHAFAENLDPHVPHPISGSLRDLPDISILFKRYLDSSKMINVYDWFESFKTVLEDQRQHYKELSTTQASASPRKRGKGKQKASPQVDANEEDDSKWDIHVQARFVRALHELDYLGLIKHTGRKADHLVRTLFDVDDAQ